MRIPSPCESFSSYVSSFYQVFQAGLNVDIAPDLIANQLNVRYGALVLQVSLWSILFCPSTNNLTVFELPYISTTRHLVGW